MIVRYQRRVSGHLLVSDRMRLNYKVGVLGLLFLIIIISVCNKILESD